LEEVTRGKIGGRRGAKARGRGTTPEMPRQSAGTIC
jgi:hypothetical protein